MTIPPARGRRGFTRDRLTFAVIVAGVDRAREGVEAIIGERVRTGRARAAVGSLLLVYGEDRDALDGRLVQHCADLYRVMDGGTLRRLDAGTFPGEWLPATLAAIEAAERPQREQRREQEAVPLDRTVAPRRGRALPAILAALTAAVAVVGPTAPARADVRASAAWTVALERGQWATIPASVCGGRLPTDYEAWSARTGRRVGDARLFAGTRPRRIVGSTYAAPVRAYVWCDADPAPAWPMVRVLAGGETRA